MAPDPRNLPHGMRRDMAGSWADQLSKELYLLGSKYHGRFDGAKAPQFVAGVEQILELSRLFKKLSEGAERQKDEGKSNENTPTWSHVLPVSPHVADNADDADRLLD